MNENRNSLDLSGYGTCPGGDFDRVNISGKGNVNGDITCSTFNISGMAKVNGDIACKNLSTSGMGTINGNIKCNEADVSGVLTVKKNVNIDELEISGMMKIQGNIYAHEIKCEGYLKSESDIECEVLDLFGIIESKGFINCETLYAQVSGECKCNEIGASNIDIQGEEKSSLIFNIFTPRKFRNKVLIASSIEGDDIKLENCEVKTVRGKNIKIGINCKIDVIEYSQSIEIHEKSSVKEINKI